MKILFDTSVLVAAVVVSHSRHTHAFGWLKRAKAKEIEPLICSHSLAELFSVLTSLPLKPKMTPGDAMRLIEETIQRIFSVVSLTSADYARVIRSLAERSLPGAIAYDALVAQAARKAEATSLLTLNPKDFQRLRKDGDPGILEP